MSKPAQSSPPAARISLSPDELSQASSRAQEALTLSTSLAIDRITTPEANQAAVDFLRDRLDPAIEFCNSLFNPILDAINQLHETTRQSRQQLTSPLVELKVRIRMALQTWDDHLREVQRQIDADRAKEVAVRSREILEQDTLDRANELIERGKEEEATRLLDSFFGDNQIYGGVGLVDRFTLPPSKAGSRADGQSSSTLKRARVIDIDKLKPEYVIKSPDTRKIQAAVTKYGKRAEEIVSVDGKGGAIEYYERGSVTIRKQRPAKEADKDDDIYSTE